MAAATSSDRRPEGDHAPTTAVPPSLAGTDYRPVPDRPGLLYSSSRGLWVDAASPGVVRCATTGAWKRARARTSDGGGSGT